MYVRMFVWFNVRSLLTASTSSYLLYVSIVQIPLIVNASIEQRKKKGSHTTCSL